MIFEYLFTMHIGSKIQEKLRESGHTVAWFARQICCTRTHVYKIFNKENIDVELLMRISNVLNYDFFQDLSDEVKRGK
jgi:plasmid maintenance system antidote protein VapI